MTRRECAEAVAKGRNASRGGKGSSISITDLGESSGQGGCGAATLSGASAVMTGRKTRASRWAKNRATFHRVDLTARFRDLAKPASHGFFRG